MTPSASSDAWTRRRGRHVQLVAEVRRERADDVPQEPDHAQVAVRRPRDAAPRDVGGRRVHARDRSAGRRGGAGARHTMGRCPPTSPSQTPCARSSSSRTSLRRLHRRRRPAPPGGRLVRLEPDGRVLAQLATPRRWCDNLKRDPRVALSVIDAADAYRWVGLTGRGGRGGRRRGAGAGRHRGPRPPLPAGGADRGVGRDVPLAAAGHVPRPDHRRPRPPRGLTVAIDQDRRPAVAADRELAGDPRRGGPRGPPAGDEPVDVGPPERDRRAVGGPDPRGLVGPGGLVAGHRAGRRSA